MFHIEWSAGSGGGVNGMTFRMFTAARRWMVISLGQTFRRKLRGGEEEYFIKINGKSVRLFLLLIYNLFIFPYFQLQWWDDRVHNTRNSGGWSCRCRSTRAQPATEWRINGRKVDPIFGKLENPWYTIPGSSSATFPSSLFGSNCCWLTQIFNSFLGYRGRSGISHTMSYYWKLPNGDWLYSERWRAWEGAGIWIVILLHVYLSDNLPHPFHTSTH